MSDDDRRRRNGHDPIVVPMPLDRPRRQPVETPARQWRSEYEWQRSMTDALNAVIPAVNDHTETLAEVHAQTIVLTRAVNRLADVVQDRGPDPDKSYHEFDPAVLALRETLKQREKDGTPFNGRSATVLVEEFDKALKERRELAVWRAIKSVMRGVAWETLKYFIPAVIVGGAAVWHWLLTAHH